MCIRDRSKGYDELITRLSAALCEITGYDNISLQPNSGAQGEYAGLLAIRGYHQANGQHPVSYTHLDVYKRQVLESNEHWHGFGDLAEGFNMLDPVSYTHLDVYKRQRCAQAADDPIPHGSHARVSFKHGRVFL